MHGGRCSHLRYRGRLTQRLPPHDGCAERFIRTLKEQLLWVETFETVEQLRLALLAFKERYNQAWLAERHGHCTPAAVRQALSPSTGAAA